MTAGLPIVAQMLSDLFGCYGHLLVAAILDHAGQDAENILQGVLVPRLLDDVDIALDDRDGQADGFLDRRTSLSALSLFNQGEVDARELAVRLHSRKELDRSLVADLRFSQR